MVLCQGAGKKHRSNQQLVPSQDVDYSRCELQNSAGSELDLILDLERSVPRKLPFPSPWTALFVASEPQDYEGPS